MEANVNYLLIAVLITILIGALNGYRKGFLRIVISLAGMVVILFGVTKLSPYVSDYLINNTNVYEKVNSKVIEAFMEENASELSEEETQLPEYQTDRINSLNLPKRVQGNLIEHNTEEVYESLKVVLFEDYISQYLTKIVIRCGSFLGLVIILGLAWCILLGVAKILDKIPVLKTINRVLGMAVGVLGSILFVWLFFLAVFIFVGEDLSGKIMQMVNSSTVLKYLFDNNLLFELVS